MENKPLTTSEAMERARRGIMSATAVPEPMIKPRDFEPLPKLTTSKDGNPMIKMTIPDSMKKKIAEGTYEPPHPYKPVAMPWWYLENKDLWPKYTAEGLMAQLETEDRLKVNKPKVYLHFI